MRMTNKCSSRSLTPLRFTLPAEVMTLLDTLASDAGNLISTDIYRSNLIGQQNVAFKVKCCVFEAISARQNNIHSFYINAIGFDPSKLIDRPLTHGRRKINSHQIVECRGALLP